jgi:Protein of unknown function (DUF3099).
MKQQSITSLPLSPDAERHHRMVKYLVAMGIRVLCIIALLFVHGWWLVIPALGAIFLPYFAVVIANAAANPNGGRVERPGNVSVLPPPPPGTHASGEKQ